MLHIKNKLIALWHRMQPKMKIAGAWCKKAIQGIRPLLKNAARLMMRYRIATTAVCGFLTLSMLMSVITVSIHEVTIIENGTEVASYHTIFTDDDTILERNHLALGEGDELTRRENDNAIILSIERAFPVYIKADGQETVVLLAKGTVADALEKAGLSCGDDDLLNLSPNALLENGMKIQLDRVTTKTVEETEEIEYDTQKIRTNDLYVGNSREVQEGKNGSKKLTYSVTYVNGKETKRELINEEVLEEPVDRIVEIGTKIKSSFKKTASTPKTYKKRMAMECTAYAAGGTTATGRPAQWGVIAVDPRVIPLGTKVYVETTDGKYIYGTAIAADTGGAIKGNIIDICVNSHAEAYRFGRRTVNVYILD